MLYTDLNKVSKLLAVIIRIFYLSLTIRILNIKFSSSKSITTIYKFNLNLMEVLRNLNSLFKSSKVIRIAAETTVSNY